MITCAPATLPLNAIEYTMNLMTMKTNYSPMLVLFMMVLYYISEVQVASCSQEGSTCSSQRCNCEVNNGVVLQTLIESMVNQSLNERLPASVEEAVEGKFQAVQQQLNDTIDEKIADIQQNIPGKELAYTIIIIIALKFILITMILYKWL